MRSCTRALAEQRSPNVDKDDDDPRQHEAVEKRAEGKLEDGNNIQPGAVLVVSSMQLHRSPMIDLSFAQFKQGAPHPDRPAFAG